MSVIRVIAVRSVDGAVALMEAFSSNVGAIELASDATVIALVSFLKVDDRVVGFARDASFGISAVKLNRASDGIRSIGRALIGHTVTRDLKRHGDGLAVEVNPIAVFVDAISTDFVLCSRKIFAVIPETLVVARSDSSTADAQVGDAWSRKTRADCSWRTFIATAFVVQPIAVVIEPIETDLVVFTGLACCVTVRAFGLFIFAVFSVTIRTSIVDKTIAVVVEKVSTDVFRWTNPAQARTPMFTVWLTRALSI